MITSSKGGEKPENTRKGSMAAGKADSKCELPASPGGTMFTRGELWVTPYLEIIKPGLKVEALPGLLGAEGRSW